MSAPTQYARYRAGRFEVDLDLRRVSAGGAEVVLQWRSFEALRILIEAHGQPVSRAVLVLALWPDVTVGESSLDKCISQLRKALGDSEGSTIETVPRVGYRLAVPLEKVVEVESPVNGPAARPVPRRRGFFLYAAGLALLAAIACWPVSAWISGRQKSARAQALYAEASKLANVRGKEQTAAAIRMLQEAIQLDPRFAGAYAALSQTMNRNVAFMGGNAPQEIVNAAKRSVELDPRCLSCQISYGFFLFYHAWDNEEAEKHLRIARAMAPEMADVHANLAMVLAATGRLDEALAEIDEAIRLTPYHAGRHSTRAMILYFQNRFPESMDESRKAVAMDAGYVAAWDWQSRAATLAKRPREGISAIVNGRFPEWVSQVNGAYARGGEAAAWRELLALTAGPASRRSQCWRRDVWWLNVNDPERALDELEACVEVHSANLAWIAVDPALAPLHGNPRYCQVVRQRRLRLASCPAPKSE